MSSEQRADAAVEPAAPSDEVWRGHVDVSGGGARGVLCVVVRFRLGAPTAHVRCNLETCAVGWHHVDGDEAARILGAWAMAERARAERAEAAIVRWHEAHVAGPFEAATRALRELADQGAALCKVKP